MTDLDRVNRDIAALMQANQLEWDSVVKGFQTNADANKHMRLRCEQLIDLFNARDEILKRLPPKS
jgi:hypothetical protein